MDNYNFPDIHWSFGIVKSNFNLKRLHQSFLNLLLIHSVEQLLHCPTHIKGNTLDLVITSSRDRLTKIEVVKPSFSDHFMTQVELNSGVLCQAENTKAVRLLIRPM